MAGNTVSLTFAGDATSLDRTFDKVGAGAKEMASDLDSAGSKARGFGGAIDAAGATVSDQESKFMGSADVLDGLGGAFGLPTEGATGLMRAYGDMAGGLEGAKAMLSTAAGALGTLASKTGLASAATAVWTGIQTAFNAVMALNPAILITAAIVGLGLAIVVAYQKSETFRNIVQGAFNTVRGAAEDVWYFIEGFANKVWGVASAIMDALLWPYKTAFNLVAKFWNNTVGSLSFSVPSWVPGLGGKGFSMPKLPTFHAGGTVPGPTGAEVPILALGGERILPPGQSAGAGPMVIQLVVDRQVLTEIVHDGLLVKQRRGGNLGFGTA